MNVVYEYYKYIIKPIEKKHAKMCTLYKVFKFKYFKFKREQYNNFLKYYYKNLLNNPKDINEIQKSLNSN